MTTTQLLPLAVASLKRAITWSWQLKLDETGLYRWYLDGTMPTRLRGCIRTHAKSALRVVEQAFLGDVQIINTPERIALDKEISARAKNLRETG